MLLVQQYLHSGKTLSDLSTDFGIVVAEHPELPLVILNYDQIESKKTCPLSRECRALVLHKEDFSLVGRSFPRFFNWGEVQEEMGDFDWSKYIVEHKHDGSLFVVSNFNSQWIGSTRGSFGFGKINHYDITWQQAWSYGLGVKQWEHVDEFLLNGITYIFEFCSPWNKIVANYGVPKLYLLTAFMGYNELSWDQVDRLQGPWERPQRYEFGDIDQIISFLSEQEGQFEGVVIRDKDNRRWKIKNPKYLSLHRMRGNGDDLFNPKNLLPFILKNETDELLTYFPEVKPAIKFYKDQVDNLLDTAATLWDNASVEVAQKDFALKVKDHPLSWALFQARKTNKYYVDLVRENPEKIIQHLDKYNHIGV